MELHVWARFDVSGKLQSVSSNFTQTPDGLCPGLVPLTVPMTGDPGERFVPYMEKKALDRKLDNKIDEMGMLVMQMAELTRKNKAMEKLIKKHEATIASQQRTIERLTAIHPDVAAMGDGAPEVPPRLFTERKKDVNIFTNVQVRDESNRDSQNVEGENTFEESDTDFSVAENNSSKHSSVTNRPSTLNIDIDLCTCISCSLNDTAVEGDGYSQAGSCGIYNVNVCPNACSNGHSNVTDVSDSGNLGLRSNVCNTSKNETVPENALNNSQSMTKHETKEDNSNDNLDDIDEPSTLHNPQKCDFSDDTDSEGYVKHDGFGRDSYLKFAIHSKDNAIPSQHISPFNSPILSGRVLRDNLDENGYLKLQGFGNDGTPSGTQSPDTSGENYFIDDAKVHMSIKELNTPVEKWQEVQGCSQSPPEWQSQVELQPVPDVYTGYIEIPYILVADIPLPTPRRRCKVSTESGDKSPDNSPTLSPVFAQLIGGGSLSRQHSDGSRSLHPPHAAEKSSSFAYSGYGHSSPDIRKDDTLNSVLKDMRTTAEWNKEKRSLMFNSTQCTAPQAEQLLGSSVQVLYKAFSTLFVQKGHARIMRYTQSQILKRVTREIDHTKSRGIDVSDEFSRKCIDLMRACFRAKTP